MLNYSSLTLQDGIKYWAAVIAISVGITVVSGRIASGVIFLLAGTVMFVYWARKSAQRKSRQKKPETGA